MLDSKKIPMRREDVGLYWEWLRAAGMVNSNKQAEITLEHRGPDGVQHFELCLHNKARASVRMHTALVRTNHFVTSQVDPGVCSCSATIVAL